MNIALSLLSAASSADAAEQGVIDRLQSYTGTEDISIAQQQLADPDYWSSVGIITLTGILVVFFILAILIFFFWLMGVIFKSLDAKKAAKAKAEADAKAKEAAAKAAEAPAPAAEVEEDYTDDDEIIAVISAAIAAYSEADGKQYEIRSIRRKDNRTRSAWSLAGIGENTRPF